MKFCNVPFFIFMDGAYPNRKERSYPLIAPTMTPLTKYFCKNG